MEGEKCAEKLKSRGVAATTTPGGAKGWKPYFARFFADRNVLILPDNDEPGRAYSESAARDIRKVAAKVSIIHLPGIDEGEDIVDWFAKGHSLEDLEALVKNPPPIKDPKSRVVRMSEVIKQDVDWLWRGRIPRGFLTFITGDPGVGKSYLAAEILSCVAKGYGLPGDGGNREGSPCLYFSAEDSPEHMIIHRLEACRAPLEQVYVHPSPLSLNDEGIAEMRREIERLKPALVIIDPIVAYLKEGTDMHRANEVRKNLSPLSLLARELDVAIVCIRHTNKGGNDQKAIHRGSGSFDFTAAARSEFLVFCDVHDREKRYLAHIKNNLGPLLKVLQYSIVDGNFIWGTELDESLDEIFARNVPSRTRAKGSPCLDAAKDFLNQILSEGPVEARLVLEGARAHRISNGNLHTAKKELAIGSRRVGSVWEWFLPPLPHLNYPSVFWNLDNEDDQ